MKGAICMINEKLTAFLTPAVFYSMMKDTLRHIHPQYALEEKAFTNGIDILKASLSENQLGLLDAYLDENERELSESLFYLFWKGVKQNLDCYSNPVNRGFLQMDFEDFLQEGLVRSLFPTHFEDLGRKFATTIPESLRDLTDPIFSYHAYMETFAYKLAHYYGFCFGDTFLSRVVPGYHPNRTITLAYKHMLKEYLSIASL